MREGNSGIYYGADGRLGYELTMLRKTVQRSWYRDAYLYAIWCEAGRPSEVTGSVVLRLLDHPEVDEGQVGHGLRSVPTGIAVQTPTTPEAVATLQVVCDVAGAEIHDGGGSCACRKPNRTAT